MVNVLYIILYNMQIADMIATLYTRLIINTERNALIKGLEFSIVICLQNERMGSAFSWHVFV